MAVAAQEQQVDSAVSGGEEDLLAVIAPLSNVVRRTDRHHARYARHAISIDEQRGCRQVLPTKC